MIRQLVWLIRLLSLKERGTFYEYIFNSGVPGLSPCFTAFVSLHFQLKWTQMARLELITANRKMYITLIYGFSLPVWKIFTPSPPPTLEFQELVPREVAHCSNAFKLFLPSLILLNRPFKYHQESEVSSCCHGIPVFCPLRERKRFSDSHCCSLKPGRTTVTRKPVIHVC